MWPGFIEGEIKSVFYMLIKVLSCWQIIIKTNPIHNPQYVAYSQNLLSKDCLIIDIKKPQLFNQQYNTPITLILKRETNLSLKRFPSIYLLYLFTSRNCRPQLFRNFYKMYVNIWGMFLKVWVFSLLLRRLTEKKLKNYFSARNNSTDFFLLFVWLIYLCFLQFTATFSGVFGKSRQCTGKSSKCLVMSSWPVLK